MLPSGLEILSIPKQEIKKMKNKKDNLTWWKNKKYNLTWWKRQLDLRKKTICLDEKINLTWWKRQFDLMKKTAWLDEKDHLTWWKRPFDLMKKTIWLDDSVFLIFLVCIFSWVAFQFLLFGFVDVCLCINNIPILKCTIYIFEQWTSFFPCCVDNIASA